MLYYIREGEDEDGCVTFLPRILDSIDGALLQATWLFTDVEANPLATQDSKLIEKHSRAWREGPFLISGEELTVATHELRIQYIWAVMSPLRPGHSVNLDDLHSLPFADCNTTLWEPDPQPQHPDAYFDLVAWDSNYTLVICRDDEWHAKILKWFPSATTVDPRPWPSS